MPAFDPRSHRLAEPRWFEDFRVGVIVMRATVHNQRGELVLDGTHKYLIRKRIKNT
jgi:acyl dehydratase